VPPTAYLSKRSRAVMLIPLLTCSSFPSFLSSCSPSLPCEAFTRLALLSQYRRWLLGEKLFFPAPAHSDFFGLSPTAIPPPTKKEVLSAYQRDPNLLGGFELAAATTAAVEPNTAGSVPHPSFRSFLLVSRLILKEVLLSCLQEWSFRGCSG
jgi:hypothetical protein